MTRKERIQEIIQQQCTPQFLDVEDESKKHNVPSGAETHFKVIVVSQEFNGLSRINRHRVVQESLEQEFQTGLHALSMYLYTPEEWVKQQDKVLKSPPCKGGSKH